MGVQRRLGASTETTRRSFERLSTGMRINRASDDAAGLAIADSLRADRRLYSAAVRNANDGISLTSIINGTLDAQSTTLTRLLELAEQSANGTLSHSQRQALQGEYAALVAESGRLGASTRFNGLQLLSGDRHGLSEILMQVGISGSTLAQLGIAIADTDVNSGNFNTATAPQNSYPDSMTFRELADFYGNQLLSTSVIDSGGRKRDLLLAVSRANTSGAQLSIYQRVSDTGPAGTSTFYGDVLNGSDEWVSGGEMILEFDDNGEVASTNHSTELEFGGGRWTGTLALDLRGTTFRAEPTSILEFSGIELSSRALTALEIVRQRLAELSQIRGDFAAVQSRLETALGNLQSLEENSAGAESRIRDVDAAEESSALLSSQIVQNAGASVLALANAQPALLLQLLTA